MVPGHPRESIRNDQYEPIGFAINFDVTFMTGTFNIFIFQRKGDNAVGFLRITGHDYNFGFKWAKCSQERLNRFGTSVNIEQSVEPCKASRAQMSAILESLGGVIIAPMQAKDGEWVSSGYLEDEKYSECLPEKASIIL